MPKFGLCFYIVALVESPVNAFATSPWLALCVFYSPSLVVGFAPCGAVESLSRKAFSEQSQTAMAGAVLC